MGSKRPARPRARTVSAPDPRRQTVTSLIAGRPRTPARAKEGVVVPMKNHESSNAKLAAASDGQAPGGENLDKVRDILFGGTMRENDRRFLRLEERLVQETAELKEEVRKRLAVLEQFVKHELESLADRLRTEQDERVDADKDHARELREMAKASEKKAGQIEDHLGRAQRELRQQLLELHQSVSEDLRSRADEIHARLAKEAAELRGDKIDRTALAALLTEMALRLTNEFSLPVVGGDSRG